MLNCGARGDECIHRLLPSPFEVRRGTLPFSLARFLLLTGDCVAIKGSLFNLQAVVSLSVAPGQVQSVWTGLRWMECRMQRTW